VTPTQSFTSFLKTFARSFVKGERVSVTSCPWQVLFGLLNIYLVIATQNVFPCHVTLFKFLNKETKKKTYRILTYIRENENLIYKQLSRKLASKFHYLKSFFLGKFPCSTTVLSGFEKRRPDKERVGKL